MLEHTLPREAQHAVVVDLTPHVGNFGVATLERLKDPESGKDLGVRYVALPRDTAGKEFIQTRFMQVMSKAWQEGKLKHHGVQEMRPTPELTEADYQSVPGSAYVRQSLRLLPLDALEIRGEQVPCEITSIRERSCVSRLAILDTANVPHATRHKMHCGFHLFSRCSIGDLSLGLDHGPLPRGPPLVAISSRKHRCFHTGSGALRLWALPVGANRVIRSATTFGGSRPTTLHRFPDCATHA